MTREEAINNLKFLKGIVLDYNTEQSIDMAIKALEQERSRSAEITQYRHNCEKLMEENERLKKALEHETCNDCVSRQAAIDVLHGYFDGMLDTDTVCPKDIYGLFECIPSAQPKTGRWKRISMDKYVQHAMAYYQCSECGGDIIGEHNYCPNCGAKMQEVKE